jgi:hypothetical protein
MALDERLHGKNGSVKMDPAGGSALVTVADLSSWSLDMSKDRVDVTGFGDTNKRKVVGLPDFSGNLGGFWNAASSPTLFAVILGSVAATLQLIPNTLDPTYYFQGLANIDGTVSVDSKGAVTFSGKWDAANNWLMAP